MIKVAICGGSGYTGAELLRILLLHPEVEITAVTSERSAGRRVSDLFPHLHRYAHLFFESIGNKELLAEKADLFFMALPHAASQEAVDFFLKRVKRSLIFQLTTACLMQRNMRNGIKLPTSFRRP